MSSKVHNPVPVPASPNRRRLIKATALAALGRRTLDAASVDATLGAVLKYREDAERARTFVTTQS